MDAISVNEEIEEAQALVAERVSLSQVQLIQALDWDIRLVWIDRLVLRHVLMSLLLNAVRHINGVGVVTITTGTGTEEAVEVTISAIGSADLRKPTDPIAAVPRYDVFRRKGKGLPLSVIRDIIEGQEGTITRSADSDSEVMLSVRLPRTCGAEAVTRG